MIIFYPESPESDIKKLFQDIINWVIFSKESLGMIFSLKLNWKLLLALKSEHKLVELDEDNGEPDEEDEDDIASATVEEFVESPSLETFLGLGEGKCNFLHRGSLSC